MEDLGVSASESLFFSRTHAMVLGIKGFGFTGFRV